jgi:hypothetical protein
MSLIKLDDDWFRFGNGIPWRVNRMTKVCEVGREGNVPCETSESVRARVRKVKSFYERCILPGRLNDLGYGIDILVANAFTESGGNVPTIVSKAQLKEIYDTSPGILVGDRLQYVIDYLKSRKETRSLVRQEPLYSNAVNSPGRISLGAHHALIQTALWLQGKKPPFRESDIEQMVLRMPSESKFAAEIAILYFERQMASHRLQPPLLAACYNAGSLRTSDQNVWGLRCYGDHIDRWVRFFNTSRLLNVSQPNSVVSKQKEIIPPIIIPKPASNNLFDVERIVAAMKKRQYKLYVDDQKPFNLNLIGLRNPNGQMNAFDDKMAVIWKYQGVWNLKLFTITTEPGRSYLVSAAEGGRVENKIGTAILVPGQYESSHRIGTHKGYPALQQNGKLLVYRDANHNGKLDYDPKTIREAGAGARINIHRANPDRRSVNVDRWSAGCQVFASPHEFNEFMDLCRKRAEHFGSVFTYTLMLWSDLG